MSNAKVIISFIIGAAAGSVATYFIVKKKCENKINTEIKDAKEYYEKKYSYCATGIQPEETSAEEVNESPLEDKDQPSNTDTVRYDKVREQIKKEITPFMIDADTYAFSSEFKKRSFVYYSDSFLVDEGLKPFKNIVGSLGVWVFDKLKDPTIDTLYIRNENERTDYMISKQNCAFDVFVDNVVQLNIPEDSALPYVINPDQWEDTTYHKAELTLYSDGILADDDGLMYNIEELIGTKSLGSFGEFEDRTVFVRNEGTETDYSVFKESSKYSTSFPDTLV